MFEPSPGFGHIPGSFTGFFVINIWEESQSQTSLNELRFHFAVTTDRPALQLPPNEDAFKQHALCARYQAIVWCQSHSAKPKIPDPIGSGWYVDNINGLQPTLCKNESDPVELRNITHLYCKDKCCKGLNCQYRQAGLECIEICSCFSQQYDNPINRKEQNVEDIGSERDFANNYGVN